jgi:hypothetical protein
MLKVPEKFKEAEFKTEKDEILIGVISDTQINTKITDLPKEVEEIFEGVDPHYQTFGVGVNLIIHAGDVEKIEFLQKLEKIAPVFAVKGNMDFGEVQKNLPAGLLIKIYNWKIGIVHSPMSFWVGSHFNQVQEIVAEKLARKENFDILVFGHTHHPYLKEVKSKGKKILLFNPGSATLPFIFSDKISVGILKISKDSFEGKIIPLTA